MSEPQLDPPPTSIALRKDQALAKSEAAPNIAGMLQAVIEKGITGENVKALESLVALYERMDSRDAQRAFYDAFNALQADMPKVKAKKPVPNSDGTVRYKFAPYEDIMAQVQPLLLTHGFTVSFSTRYEDGRLVKICTMTHIRGHSQSNEFAVRVGKGPPGSSESQGDGAAATYAKRFALCDALNIVTEMDTDGDPRAEGSLITKDQASDLKRRVMETGSDEAAFLKYADAKSYTEIRAAKYSILDASLRRKEKTT